MNTRITLAAAVATALVGLAASGCSQTDSDKEAASVA